MIMVCVGFVSRSEEPRQGRALAHAVLLAHCARPDDEGLRPPPAFSERGYPAEHQDSQDKVGGPLGKAPPGAAGSRSEELCVVAPQRRRRLANCAGGSRPLQRLLANLAGAPGGRSSGSWQSAPETPSGTGRLRLGGARSVGRTGRMSERWRCGRATGSEHHGIMHCCTHMEN